MSKKSLILGTLTLFVAFSVLSFPVLTSKAEGASRGWLGVYIQDITSELMEAMDLSSLKGVLVNEVIDDSPADEAGIERGDVIIKFNDKKVMDAEQLIKLVRKAKPNHELSIRIIRDGEKKALVVKIGKKSEADFYGQKFKVPKHKEERIKIFSFGESAHGRIGAVLWDLNEQIGEYFGVEDGEGALIAELDEDAPGYQAGLRAGDVIVEIDNKEIENKEDVSELLSDKEEGDEVKIEVFRKGSSKTFNVEVEEGEDWFSSSFEDMDDIKIYKSTVPPMEPLLKKYQLEHFEEEKLRDELEELKDELKDLKRELEKLKEEL